ncbi:MAG TPA: hypothetical protein VJ140_18520, partial [Actinomycetota bacterium]|nr:hypothetical protein [Actinomycetota bacterium]
MGSSWTAILAYPSARPPPQRSLYPACTPHHHHHLMWMGADPLASIAALGDAVYHVHAKDTRI